MRWRKWNHVLHRDIGYLCIGLTLIYAISGILVNHTSHSFNPSYTIVKSSGSVTPLPADKAPDMDYVKGALAELDEQGTFKNVARINPSTLRIFVEGNTIDINLNSGKVLEEKVDRRPLLFELNYLHLNKGKGVWTWLADIYGVALLIVALTGMLMIRGRTKVRGIALTMAGFLLPLVYLIIVL